MIHKMKPKYPIKGYVMLTIDVAISTLDISLLINIKVNNPFQIEKGHPKSVLKLLVSSRSHLSDSMTYLYQ